jgi:hypothetical protein
MDNPQNEMVRAFAESTAIQMKLIKEYHDRIAALETYLESRDPDFRSEFQQILAVERKKIENPFEWWKKD